MKLVFHPGAMRTLEAAIEPDLRRRAIQVETSAKRTVRVDTGRLRASIGHDVTRDAQGPVAFVGSDVEYAIHVENRYPYLVPALDAAKR